MKTDGQEYWRCADCGEFVNSSEAGAHKCPKAPKAPKRRKWMSQHAYVNAKGGVCPACGGDQYENTSADIDGGDTSQEYSCIDCGAAWVDCYKLTGYIKKEEPG